MKAMILAAGRGQRLAPITDHIPKPLLKIGPHRLIEYHLIALAAAGFSEVIINVSHLAEMVMVILGNGDRYGIKITYSHEKEQALETGGGIFNALHFFDGKHFLVINGDIWTDYPLQNLRKNYDTLAHVILVNNPSHNLKGDYYFSQNKITEHGSQKLTFAGINVYHPELFKDCQPGKFRLPPLLQTPIIQERVSGEHYQGHWVDVGTEERLKQLETLLQTLK